MHRLVEFRSYKLVAGGGAKLHDLMTARCLPLLRAHGMEVVACGQSLHDPDAYILVRAYDDLDDLRRSQEAFYGSDAWTAGPRQSIIDLIESYWNIVMWLTPEAIGALRSSAPFAAR